MAKLELVSPARTDPARELLWTVCHDFANQMAMVRLRTQGLLMRVGQGDPPNEGEWAAAMTHIDRVARSAAALMEDVLGLERDQARLGAAVAPAGLVDFEETLDDVLTFNAETLAQAGCAVLVTRDGGPDRIRGRWQRGAIERLLSNLLQNVARHAPGAPARIHLTQKLGWLHVWFSDGGPGLPSTGADFGRQAFVGAVGPDAQHGLGLWIIHRSVAALDGEIEMRNVPGSGLAFEIRLPLGT
jgi:signal transduction histidine kinase